MFLVLTAPPVLFWQPPVCFVGCRFYFSPWMFGNFWWCQLSTWSYLLLLSPRSCFGSLWRGVPPKGAGYTDINANKWATGEVPKTTESKKVGESYRSFSFGGCSGLGTSFSSIKCGCVFLALMGQWDDSETKTLAEARILNGLCLQPQGICLTS